MEKQRDKYEAWKYLVDDFLEMACFLDEKERGFLIEKINASGVRKENISSHPSFSLSGKLIAVAEKETVEELWIYDTKLKEVKCFKLVEVPGAGSCGNYRWSKSLKH